MSKTTTKAELVLASKNVATGDVLFTFLLTFPRPILAEVNTHRMASRNTSSSRAIPGRKMRSNVLRDCFVPMSLGENQKGMQAGAEIVGWKRKAIEATIALGSKIAVAQSWLLEKLGAHKQVSNRYLEPYSWCQQVFSLTEMENLLLLRNHPDAEPHFHELAKQIAWEVEHAQARLSRMQEIKLYGLGGPDSWQYRLLEPGEWHLPFVLIDEEVGLSLEAQKRISTARCARTSYRLLDTGEMSNIGSDTMLCERLFGSTPMHLSPTEHPAEAMEESYYCGNYKGFRQYRKTIAGESGTTQEREEPCPF